MSALRPGGPDPSPELYEKIINSPSFQSEVSSYQRKTGLGLEQARRDVAKLVYHTFFNRDGTPKNFHRMSKSPTGPRALFLYAIGRGTSNNLQERALESLDSEDAGERAWGRDRIAGYAEDETGPEEYLWEVMQRDN